jgi:hypothetical protein
LDQESLLAFPLAYKILVVSSPEGPEIPSTSSAPKHKFRNDSNLGHIRQWLAIQQPVWRRICDGSHRFIATEAHSGVDSESLLSH